MGHSKGIAFTIGVAAVIAAVFNVVAFAVPFGRNDVFWLSYAFVWVAIVLFVLSCVYVFSRGKTATSALYRVSFPTIATTYLVIAGILGIVFIAIPAVPFWVVLVVNVVLIALVLLGLIGGHAGAEIVDRQDQALREETGNMMMLRSRFEGLRNAALDERARRVLAETAEDFRMSDPRSSQATWTVEQQLFGYADQISVALEANDIDGVERLCTETRSVLAQRNVACKAAKRYQG